jgi:redox-sensing transcriptional repressor
MMYQNIIRLYIVGLITVKSGYRLQIGFIQFGGLNMPKHEHVSLSVIRRLPRYYRFLGDLVKSGITRISSRELSQRMGLTASQIRQDLNCFGGFGQQGYGYNTSVLRDEISSILGIKKDNPSIIVGAGNIGRAIALNMDFANMGFDLIGIFDVREEIIGTRVRDITIRDMCELEDFCKKYKPRIAVLTTPRDVAPVISEQLINLGVIGFWNFSHYDFSVKYPNIAVEKCTFR